MKNIFTTILILCFFVNVQAQLKMTAKSSYGFNGNTFYVLDTSVYFNNPANTNPVNENFTDAYNYAIYDSSHFYYYNQATQVLDFITRSVVTFDAGFAHQTLATSYNYTNNVIDTRDDFSNFYTGNNLDSQYFEHTIISPPSTIFYSKNFIHYNVGNYADTAWSVSFQNGVYNKTNKFVYTFNAQNLIDETFAFESTDSVTYTDKTKSKNYYNIAGNIDSIVSYFWQAGSWYNYKKQQYTYNANNMRTSSEVFSFNIATQLYIPSDRMQYTRTNGTLLDSTYGQSYNQTTLKYDTLNKSGYIHNNGLLLHQHLFTFNQVTNLWERPALYSVMNYYYNYLPNSVEDISNEKNQLVLYPNPCETYLNIQSNMQGAKFAIYSTDGKFMQSGIVNSDHKIFVQTLPEGMYIFNSELNGRLLQGQFIKQ